MNVDLSAYQPGAYAVIRDVVPWGVTAASLEVQAKIRKAQKEENDDIFTPQDDQKFMLMVLNNMVREWKIKDDDGNDLPSPRDIQDKDLRFVDARIIGMVFQKARDAMNAEVNADPNSGSASSTS